MNKEELKEAIIKALTKTIAEEIKKEFGVPYGFDKDELAEKRFMYGLALSKEPEEW